MILDALVEWGAASGARVYEVGADALVAGDLGPMVTLAEALELHWNAESADRFVAREHWHAG